MLWTEVVKICSVMCWGDTLSTADTVSGQRGLLTNEHLFEMSSATPQGKLRIFRPPVFYVEKTDNNKKISHNTRVYTIYLSVYYELLPRHQTLNSDKYSSSTGLMKCRNRWKVSGIYQSKVRCLPFWQQQSLHTFAVPAEIGWHNLAGMSLLKTFVLTWTYTAVLSLISIR